MDVLSWLHVVVCGDDRKNADRILNQDKPRDKWITHQNRRANETVVNKNK